MSARRILRAFLCISLALGLAGCGRLVDGLRSHAPPQGSESAARVAAGPFEVATTELELVDDSRPTQANRDWPGAPTRTLATTVWWPEDAPGPRPLVVYGHGYTGNRGEMAFLLEHLASHGYVVGAIDFPLTNGEAPGGPTPVDLAAQPGDLRFTIDELLARSGSGELPARIDGERIAVAGLSYGGLTSTLLGFHVREADPRLDAVVSIAGPTQMFVDGYFERGGPPFLMVAGTEDGLVPWALNARPLAGRPGIGLVTLDGGTHLGFTEFAGGFLRFARNPDEVACEAIAERFGDDDALEEAGDPFEPLAGPDANIDAARWERPCSGDDYGDAQRPQRQHLLTALAVRAFLDAELEGDASARRFLESTLATELADVSVSAETLAAR